jgi:hypothetical protein
MNKIRIAVASALLSALLGGAAIHGASAAQPTHAEAGPVTCCDAVFMSTN